MRMKTIGITQFSAPDYIAQAIEGVYGLDGRKNIYFTCVKNVVTVNAAGPLEFDEVLPEACLPWHLAIYGGTQPVRTVYVPDNHLSFTLSEGETATGTFRVKG